MSEHVDMSAYDTWETQLYLYMYFNAACPLLTLALQCYANGP